MQDRDSERDSDSWTVAQEVAAAQRPEAGLTFPDNHNPTCSTKEEVG